MKKRKLGTKVIILMVIFSLLIIVSTCIAVVVRYREDALEVTRTGICLCKDGSSLY